MAAPISIAIVGRPNVGKSALFNALVGRKLAIVHDEAGVTRDFVASRTNIEGRACEIIDTGGIGSAPDPDFARQTHQAAERALGEADVLLLVVDGRAGLTPLDEELARRLRGAEKPVILVVNKIDNPKREDEITDFLRLGFEHVVGVSAVHARGVRELAGLAASLVPCGEEGEADERTDRVPRVAVVGKPNAGKSSLVNAILGDERVIVSEIAGTTRDSVDVPFVLKGRPYVFVDTAGLRHRSRHNTSVEVFSAMRAEKSIRSADLCILVADCSAGITSQDKRIAGLVEEAGKSVVLVLSKWDLVEAERPGREARDEYVEETRRNLFFVRHAPVVRISSRTRHGLGQLFEAIGNVREAAASSTGTRASNRILGEAMERQSPPVRQNRRFKILYATQINHEDARPFAPVEFLLFVNDRSLITPAYENYLKAAIRSAHPLSGVPIHFLYRRRQQS